MFCAFTLKKKMLNNLFYLFAYIISTWQEKDCTEIGNAITGNLVSVVNPVLTLFLVFF